MEEMDWSLVHENAKKFPHYSAFSSSSSVLQGSVRCFPVKVDAGYSYEVFALAALVAIQLHAPSSFSFSSLVPLPLFSCLRRLPLPQNSEPNGALLAAPPPVSFVSALCRLAPGSLPGLYLGCPPPAPSLLGLTLFVNAQFWELVCPRV